MHTGQLEFCHTAMADRVDLIDRVKMNFSLADIYKSLGGEEKMSENDFFLSRQLRASSRPGGGSEASE